VKDMYLHPEQVRDLCREAMDTGDALTLDCIRKTPASKPGGPGEGDLHTLVVGKSPIAYQRKTASGTFTQQDRDNGVQRVWSVDRNGWRCVNVEQVKFVHYRGQKFEVVKS
jgi:hypothetical protein